MRSLKILPLCAFIAGCASSSAEIRPSYVSPLQYQNLSCQQLGAEAERVSRRASEVAGVQDSNKTSDALVTGAAIVLFWPAAFFVKGDGPTAAELARLKGEFEAIEQASIQKNCGLRFQRPQAETSSINKRRDQRAEQQRSDASN
jgi:hypothetical protein